MIENMTVGGSSVRQQRQQRPRDIQKRRRARCHPVQLHLHLMFFVLCIITTPIRNGTVGIRGVHAFGVGGPNANGIQANRCSLISSIRNTRCVRGRALNAFKTNTEQERSQEVGTAATTPQVIADNEDEAVINKVVTTLESTEPNISMETKLVAVSPELLSSQKVDNEEESPLADFLWRGVIVILCALWASNFAAAKLVMNVDGVDSSLYAVSRFTIAALSLLPFSVRTVLQGRKDEAGETASQPVLDLETAKAAASCGAWVAFGYLGQTLGLLTTTASRSCVICSLHCVFVAILAEIWRVDKAKKAGRIGTVTDFDLKRLVPAVVAVLGVAIVELQGAAGGPTIGDALSVAQPIGFGMGYLQLEQIMAKNPQAALPVSCIKLLVVATASLGMFELRPFLHLSSLDAAGLSEAAGQLSLQIPNFGAILDSPVALGGILYTGLITTALALWVESVAFARVPATDASIILTTEPIFAAGAGALTLGETFGMSDYVGASMIIAACVMATLIDVPGDDKCEIGSEGEISGECEPEKEWPLGGFW